MRHGTFGFGPISVIGLVCLLVASPTRSEHESLPPDYPSVLERNLSAPQSELATQGQTLDWLLRGSDLYLSLADDLFNDETHKRPAYEAAADIAKRALDDRNAQGHFLYAAALWSAERLKGIANAGPVLGEIKQTYPPSD